MPRCVFQASDVTMRMAAIEETIVETTPKRNTRRSLNKLGLESIIV
jgi:hypothetical protein